MIAKFSVTLPCSFGFVLDAEYPISSFSRDGYLISVQPLNGRTQQDDASLTINGQPAAFAEVLEIVFRKDQFDRSIEAIDPPLDTLQSVFASVLQAIRHVTHGFPITVSDLRSIQWDIEYP